MFSFLSKIFRSKKEFEARMRPAAGSAFGGAAEVEFERWSDGEVEIEAEIKRSTIPNGSAVEVIVAGRALLTLTVHNGFAKSEMRFTAEERLPEIKAGDAAEMRAGGQVIYQGTFKRD